MSHGHTHAPGEDHNHSHGPQQPPPLPPPDAALQALIDQEFTPLPVTLTDNNTVATCAAHHLEKCDPCNVDFIITNRLARLLAANPTLKCPPPNNVVSQNLSKTVTHTKDEGNTLFKSSQPALSIPKYTAAALFAVQRPPWESNNIMREELSAIISNRSAAFFEVHDYISALADAETVITIRRNWSKGHFRKAKALMGLERFTEAADAVRAGLAFEPSNNELLTFLADVERIQLKREEKKHETPPESPLVSPA